jgi:hypothetical protein
VDIHLVGVVVFGAGALVLLQIAESVEEEAVHHTSQQMLYCKVAIIPYHFLRRQSASHQLWKMTGCDTS